MLLTMRRENELHSTTSTLAPEVVSSSISIANGLTNCTAQNQDAFSIQDTTRCSPLQYSQSSSVQTSQALTTGLAPIGYYTTNANNATYLHHYPMYAPSAQVPSSIPYTTIINTTATTTVTATTVTTSTSTLTTNTNTDGNNILCHHVTPTTDLDEYVDILQVQQLLLDTSAQTSSSASQSRSASPNSNKYNNTVGKSSLSVPQHQQHQHLQQTHRNFTKKPRLHIPKPSGQCHAVPGN